MVRLFILSLLIPATSFAQEATDAAAPAAGSPFASLLPLLLIFAVFYFLLIKPQQKRMKEHQATLSALKKGDDVVTGGGILGKITKVGADDTVTVEIAKGVEVLVAKGTISGVVGEAKTAAPEKKKSGANKNDNAVVNRESIANDN